MRTIGLIEQRLRVGYKSLSKGTHVQAPPSGCTKRSSNRGKPKVRLVAAGTRRTTPHSVILPRRRGKMNRDLGCCKTVAGRVAKTQTHSSRVELPRTNGLLKSHLAISPRKSADVS